MTDREIVQAYVQAYKEGYVYDVESAHGCNSECGDCPADNACTQLSEHGNSVAFTKNYKQYIDDIKAELGE